MLLPSLIVFTTLASSAAAHTANKAKRNHITVPLNQHQGKIDLIKHTIHAAAKHSGGRGRHRFALEPETLDAGFWYGVFNVGEAHNLSLLIDTGSPDVAVNPGLYKPSRASRNLSEAGSLEYGTVEENGCGAANISYQAYTDYVSQAGLVARNQTFGNVIPNPAPVVAGTITSFPHDGIVGFGVPPANETQIGGTPFFQDLCNQGAVRECRFGLAFQTSGKGTQVLGGLDHALVSGELSRANSNADWDTTGSVAINGTTLLLQNETFLLDSGTANIVGPPAQVRALFNALGLQTVEQNLPGCTSVLFGYYPCDSPPTVGYQIGNGKPIFNIEPSAFEQANNGGNNCTSIVTGIDFGSPDFWVIGQAWFQGKYVDFNVPNKSIGVALLKE